MIFFSIFPSIVFPPLLFLLERHPDPGSGFCSCFKSMKEEEKKWIEGGKLLQ